ncbi:MAG: hypothetical protein ACE5QF_07360 [Thermoplasmata archaeon]
MRNLKLTRVECPRCHSPLVSKQRDEDLLFLCECGTMHTRDPEPKEIPYEIARHSPVHKANRVYVPFWRVSAYVAILDSDVAGGYLYNLSTLLGRGGQSSGNIDIHVPGSKLPAEEFRRLAIALTNSPPRYSRADDFGGVLRMPCNISEKEAQELADFVILTNEAEKPGTLQYIRYDMTISNVSVLFLPFTREAWGGLNIDL